MKLFQIHQNDKQQQPIESFSKRQKEADKILSLYPDRIPVICERSDDNIPDIDKKKYLVPHDLTMGQFAFVIRKRIRLSPEKVLFVYVKNKLVPLTFPIKTLYDNYKNLDGFLYITYAGENVFG